MSVAANPPRRRQEGSSCLGFDNQLPTAFAAQLHPAGNLVSCHLSIRTVAGSRAGAAGADRVRPTPDSSPLSTCLPACLSISPSPKAPSQAPSSPPAAPLPPRCLPADTPWSSCSTSTGVFVCSPCFAVRRSASSRARLSPHHQPNDSPPSRTKQAADSPTHPPTTARLCMRLRLSRPRTLLAAAATEQLLELAWYVRGGAGCRRVWSPRPDVLS